jgi:hypothetical protein
MKRDLEELGWRGVVILAVFVGLFMGLAVAPELPSWAPWAIGGGTFAIYIAVLVLSRWRRPR